MIEPKVFSLCYCPVEIEMWQAASNGIKYICISLFENLLVGFINEKRDGEEYMQQEQIQPQGVIHIFNPPESLKMKND